MARICMIAYTFYTSDARVRREAEALAARGDEVDFIALREGSGSMPASIKGVRLFPLAAGRYQGGSAVAYLIRYGSFCLRAFFLVSRLFLRKRYDIIHVHTMPDFLVFTALLPKWLGAKVVLDVHDLMPELYVSKFKLQPDHPIIRLITWVERRSIAFAHRAIAVHVPHRDALVAHGTPVEKFAVLLNVPDPAIFQEATGAEPKSTEHLQLIYHGTVAERHGLQVAVRALQRVKAEVPQVRLLVIGAGDGFDAIKRLVAETEMEQWVHFLGRMPVDKLPAYLRAADVGLVPILHDEFTRYMLPVKLMEYVGMGIPAIVSRTSTIEAYFDEDMVDYFSPGSEEELGDCILRLHHDPERRRRLVRNAARFNAEYSWEAQKKVFYELVDSLAPPAKAVQPAPPTPVGIEL